MSSEELLELATDKGFINAFWRTLRLYRSKGSTISQREVFEQLNEQWEYVMGDPRFPSFDAFRKCRDRHFRGA